MANWDDNWQGNKRKFWVRTDSIPFAAPPETIPVKPRMVTESAPVRLRNGLPAHVPYAWNGAERYRQMGIAMSLFTVRQRIRAAQRLMQETVRRP